MEFQRIARRDNKVFLSDQCKEIEETLTSIDLRGHAARSRNRLFDALLHFDLNRASDTKQSMPHIFQSLVFYFIIP